MISRNLDICTTSSAAEVLAPSPFSLLYPSLLYNTATDVLDSYLSYTFSDSLARALTKVLKKAKPD